MTLSLLIFVVLFWLLPSAILYVLKGNNWFFVSYVLACFIIYYFN